MIKDKAAASGMGCLRHPNEPKHWIRQKKHQHENTTENRSQLTLFVLIRFWIKYYNPFAPYWEL